LREKTNAWSGRPDSIGSVSAPGLLFAIPEIPLLPVRAAWRRAFRQIGAAMARGG
jgi:hypothetical protein